MDKATFRQHLDQATTMLIDFTKTLCYNDIAGNYKYRITPNSRTDDEHLTDNEIAVLNTWNKYESNLLNADEIVELFNHDNKVPVWIDITIYEAGHDLTIIDLFCSRRLRNDDELYHQGKIMPFHLQVAIPPQHLKIEKNSKFDVNWKKRMDDKRTANTLLTRLKKIFTFTSALSIFYQSIVSFLSSGL